MATCTGSLHKRTYTLRIDLEDFENETRVANYEHIIVGSEADWLLAGPWRSLRHWR